jgi:hypothetical protein
MSRLYLRKKYREPILQANKINSEPTPDTLFTVLSEGRYTRTVQ